MKRVLRRELANLVSGFLATFILFLIIFVWRIFNSSWFLFLQILSSSVLLYSALLYLGKKLSWISGKELVSVLIAFTITCTFLLNIDRSRSFFVLKWVNVYSTNGYTTLDTIVTKKQFDTLQKEALKQRIAEQGESFTLSIQDDKLSLTFLGVAIVKISILFSKIFKLSGYINA